MYESLFKKFKMIAYRTRGSDPRIQINKTEKKKVKININKSPIIKKLKIEKKSTLVIRLIIIIFKYSLIKIKANIPALYSVLKPDTSSLSPSLKSKGVRFVSARQLTNQRTEKGRILIIRNELLFICI